MKEQEVIDVLRNSDMRSVSNKVGGGLCPMCRTRDQLKVSDKMQVWFCFTCNYGGIVFNWVMKHEGIGFAKAVERVRALSQEQP